MNQVEVAFPQWPYIALMNDEIAPEPPTKSPLVTVIGWLMIIGFGSALFPAAMALLKIGPILLRIPLVGLSVLLLVAGVVLGVGLLRRRNWARIGAVWLLLVLVIGNFAQHLFFEPGTTDMSFGAGETSRVVVETSFLSGLIYLVVCGGGIYVLSRPDVKREFGVGAQVDLTASSAD